MLLRIRNARQTMRVDNFFNVPKQIITLLYSITIPTTRKIHRIDML